MKHHYPQLLSNLKYQPGEKIIDIGGAMDPCEKADVVVDIMNLGRGGQSYYLCDLNTTTLPFEDKSFDIALCCQTLEDLCSPRLIMSEMIRVAKRGVIEVPHRGAESVKGIFHKFYNGEDKPDCAWPEVFNFGQGHHKWLIEEIDGRLIFVPKIYYMLMLFPIPKWTGPGGITFYWENSFNRTVHYDTSENSMVLNYAEFRERNKQYWE